MDLWWKFWHRQPRSGSFSHDELEHVAVGDPDPTSDAATAAHGYRKCRFEWVDEASQILILSWSCTRELGHQGQHIAGTGERVAAVHPQLLQYRDTTSRHILVPTSDTPQLVSSTAKLWVTVMRDQLIAGRRSPLPC